VVGEYHISEPERLVQEALNETLLDYEIEAAPSVLVHLEGGSNFTLGTLDRVLRALRHRLGEPDRLVMGTRVRSEPSEVLRLTAVIGGLRPRTVRDAVTPKGARPLEAR
jgi:cell division GTPase FtsZ